MDKTKHGISYLLWQGFSPPMETYNDCQDKAQEWNRPSLVAHLPGDMLALESALKPLADALEDMVQDLQVGGGDPVRRQARPIKGGVEGSMTPQSGRSAVSLQGI
jgi:hypothetical protein